jgi:pimeloyl-ACP methyl ester carboxylesterase
MELSIGGKKAYAYTGGKPFSAKLPTIVFLHGGEHDHSVWSLQSRYFAHHGYGVLAPDLPGHGRSEGPALTRIEDMAEWVLALLEAAGAGKASALVGQSMGSLIALDFAGRFASHVGRIALLATAFPMRVSPELLHATENDEQTAKDMINLWSHSSHAHYPSNPGPGFWVLGGNARLMQRADPGVLYADFAACNNYSAGLHRAAQLRCPALFLLGRRDQMTPPRGAQQLANAMRDARVVEIEGAGHNLMAEKPDQVLDELIDFMTQAKQPA